MHGIGANDGLAAASGDVTLLRLVLDGSRRFALDVEGDAALTPSLEVEVRHDGDVAGTASGRKSGSAALRRSVAEAAGSRLPRGAGVASAAGTLTGGGS